MGSFSAFTIFANLVSENVSGHGVEPTKMLVPGVSILCTAGTLAV